MRVVVKLGGRVAEQSLGVVRDLHAAGSEVVVVHGAGQQISAELEARGLPVVFVDGRRFTDSATLDVVRASLIAVGAGLTAALAPGAVHLVGDEIGLQADLVPELGLVGEPIPRSYDAIVTVLSDGRLPVVTPIAVGPLNVNADAAAAALAAGLGAERLLFVSDVPGVLFGGEVVRLLRADDAAELVDAGAFEGGIVPKLLAAVRAARHGVAAEIGETVVVA